MDTIEWDIGKLHRYPVNRPGLKKGTMTVRHPEQATRLPGVVRLPKSANKAANKLQNVIS